ncbi:YccF domain-containing protein [Caniella muris]|uniref:YccF domain-containing protein n=1 Tax=Caniella muris TaxID=2941502 RepID=UPI00204200A4|nr:YccF domain-containing protein [Caniella muris]
MRTLGNIIWLVTGGLVTAAGWLVVGLLWCVTVVGIPVGRQAFKMAALTLTPFGKTIVYGGGLPSCLANGLWFVFGGVEMALGYLAIGSLLCLTVVGVPFGLQLFKMAKLSLLPFGAEVR